MEFTFLLYHGALNFSNLNDKTVYNYNCILFVL